MEEKLMEEKSKIRIKFEIGEIKFEAEGAADLVEKERSFLQRIYYHLLLTPLFALVIHCPTLM